ncbi:MAG: hypothetical protein J1F05_03365 [Muribaculaceae bacterium]|nr:hypothetical protein [Muribaculaceae bacterium]
MEPDEAERMLINAIKKTKKDQIWTDNTQSKLLKEKGITINIISRLNSHKGTKAYRIREKLQFNGEYDKQISKNKYVYPDIIFHGGQNIYDNQKFACEAKRYDKINMPSTLNLLFYDLYKLVSYLYLLKDNDPVGFDRVYMMIIGCDKDTFLKFFEKLPKLQKRINENNNISKEVDNINLGVKVIRKYFEDHDKKEHLKFIFIPKNYQEEDKIQTISLEQLKNESSDLKNFINNFNNQLQ